jgi:hypothetical protein
LQKQILVLSSFKGILKQKANSNKKISCCSLYQIADADFDDLFGKFKAIFETALAHESGPGGIV